METLYAIEIGRVSTPRQEVFGDSMDDQLKQLKITKQRVSKQYSCNIRIAKTFPFAESASVSLDSQPVQKVLNYCRASKVPIRFAFVMCINRFTRGGAVVYGQLKTELAKLGITLVDAYGVISTTKINTLEHLGFSYWWSEYSPTFKNELLEAEESKEEVTRIQTRMIGAAIRYVQLGYWRGSTPLGFTTKRVETEHGRRLILQPHPEESIWFIKMFELTAQGVENTEIIKVVNEMGFKTKKLYYRDKVDRAKIVAIKGGRKLNIKMLRNYIRKPLYAGVNTEKWTGNNPVYLKGGGLISVDLFNEANQGKIVIFDEAGRPKVYKGKVPQWQQKKLKINKRYPYKQYVLCPLCRKPLLASASRGKLGKYYAAYHCSRGHKYYRVPIGEFEIVIQKFVRKVKFSDKFIHNFEKNFLKNWNKRMEQLNKDTIDWEKRIIELREKQVLFEDKIKMATTPIGFQIIEGELEEIKGKIAKASLERSHVEDKEVDIQTLINSATYWMEHFEELVINTPNSIKKATLFGMIFEEPPTYEELENGTPKLSPLFALNTAFNEGQNQLSGADGTQFEPLLLLLNTLKEAYPNYL